MSEGLEIALWHANLTLEDVASIRSTLDTIELGLRREIRVKLLAETRKTPIDPEWLASARDGLEKCNEEIDDYLLEAVLNDTCELKYLVRHFCRVADPRPNCGLFECWFGTNCGRIDEYDCTYYYVFDPAIRFCRICFKSMTKIPDDIDVKVFIPQLRSALNKRQKN